MANYIGTPGDDFYSGGGAADTIDGRDGNDTLFGGAGIDTIDGGCGNDIIDGGADADTVNGAAGDDTITFDLTDHVDGGSGREVIGDMATISLVIRSGASGFYLDLRGASNGGTALLSGGGSIRNVERYTIVGSSGADTVLLADGADLQRFGAYSNFVSAGGGADIVIGGAGSDYIHGGAGADYLSGGAGADFINGGTLSGGDAPDADSFADTLLGGAGSDLLLGGNLDFFDGGADIDWAEVSYYNIAGGQYVDIRALDPSASFALPGGGSVLNIERVGFAFNNSADVLFHNDAAGSAFLNAGNDVAIMAGGDDYVAGGNGADYIDGGDGHDIIYVNSNNTVAPFFGFVLDNASRLIDFDNSGAAFFEYLATGFQFENDFAVDQVLGGAGNDTIVFAGSDYVEGGAGVDLAVVDLSTGGAALYYDFTNITAFPFYPLVGNGGMSGIERVFMFGGFAADTIIDTNLSGGARGGQGNDILVGQGGDDLLVGDAGNDYLDGGADDDILRAGAGIDQLFGGGGNDTLIGDDAETNLDVLVGGDGDDLILARNQDYIDGGAGTDHASIDFSNTFSSLYLDFAAAFGGGAMSYVGGGSIRGVESVGVVGTSAADTILDADWNGVIKGGLGNDVLVGRGGDDELTGGDGVDYLDGGAGDDALIGGAGNDTLIGGDGDDVLGAVLDEAGNDILVGGLGADAIFAGAGNDYVDGGAGLDSLYGGSGNDQIVGGDGADVLFGGSGVDFLTGGAGGDIFGVDGLCDDQYSIITDFNASAGDRLRIDGGGVFLGFVTGDYDGDGQADDTLLGFAGGNVVVFGVSGLSLAEWNAYLV